MVSAPRTATKRMTSLPHRYHHHPRIIAALFLAIVARSTIAFSVTPTANNKNKNINHIGRTNKIASLPKDQNLRFLVHQRKPSVGGSELVIHNGNRFYHNFSSLSSYCMVCFNFILIGVVVSMLLIKIPRILLTLLHDFVGLSWFFACFLLCISIYVSSAIMLFWWICIAYCLLIIIIRRTRTPRVSFYFVDDVVGLFLSWFIFMLDDIQLDGYEMDNDVQYIFSNAFPILAVFGFDFILITAQYT